MGIKERTVWTLAKANKEAVKTKKLSVMLVQEKYAGRDKNRRGWSGELTEWRDEQIQLEINIMQYNKIQTHKSFIILVASEFKIVKSLE